MPKRHGVFEASLCGAVAGLAGALAMNLFQGYWSRRAMGFERGHGAQSLKFAGPPMDNGKPENPNTLLAARVAGAAGVEATDQEREWMGVAGHYALGAALGAVYGAVSDAKPEVTVGRGTAFGLLAWLALDQAGLTAAGLARPPKTYPAWVHAYSLTSHLVFGAATDGAFRALAALARP